jgi:hypothetical protein
MNESFPPLRATRKPFDCQFVFDIQTHRFDEFASDTESRRSHHDQRGAKETTNVNLERLARR